MKKRQKYPSLGLLNFEGNVLIAYRKNDLYVILDQYKEVVFIASNSEFQDFIEGHLSIVDSKGKDWNFVNEHENAKPTMEKIKEFQGLSI
jgi:hypothetical protein